MLKNVFIRRCLQSCRILRQARLDCIAYIEVLMSLEAFSEKFFIFSFSMRKRREKITRAGNPEQSIVSFAISKTLYTFRSSCWSRKFRCNKFPPRSPESQRSHKKGNFVSREVMQTGEWNPPERKISDSLFVKKLRAGSKSFS